MVGRFKKYRRILAVAETLVIVVVLVSLCVMATPKFLELKKNARMQSLDTIALQLEKNSRFVRAQAFQKGVLFSNNKYYIVCLNGFTNERCNRQGYNNDIISTDMIIVQKGYPFSGLHEAVAVATLLGYHYQSTSYSELRKSISDEIPIFPTCDGYCHISDLKNVCNAPFCLQESREGTLVVPQGLSASDNCYVRYYHSGQNLPVIAIENGGC